MTSDWLRFLCLRVPLMLVLLALAAEGAAWLLGDAPRLRHPLDRLVHALDHVKVDAPVVLVGDSITQDLAKSYRLGPAGRIANLTTNQASGTPGVLFLVRRYLSSNTAPRHVVLAATPEFLGYAPDGHTFEVYLRSVFTHRDERAWLRKAGLTPGRPDWSPAILGVEAGIFDPLVGLLQSTPTGLAGGGGPLDQTLRPEPPGGNAIAADVLKGRSAVMPKVHKAAGQALGDLCRLLEDRGIAFHILWAPAPATVHAAWRRRGYLEGVRRAILDIAGPACAKVRFDDFNRETTYPDHAFRDSDHLRRPGWLTHYGVALRDYIAGLD